MCLKWDYTFLSKSKQILLINDQICLFVRYELAFKEKRWYIIQQKQKKQIFDKLMCENTFQQFII